MRKKEKENEQEKLLKSIINAMQDKKARKIVSMDLRQTGNDFTDHFLICHGTSKPHVDSIADNVEGITFKELGIKPRLKEGYENKEWILLDYFDIIVHVFLEDKRDFFGLEELWGDGNTKYIEEPSPAEIQKTTKTKRPKTFTKKLRK